MLWFTTHEMNVKSDYINWACCQIVTFLLFNCLPSLSLSLTSHIFSPTSRFACLVFLYAVLHNWLFSKFPQTAWSRWGSQMQTCVRCEHVQLFVFPTTVRQKCEIRKLSEDIKGSKSESVHDYLCYYSHYRYLQYWLFEAINNSLYKDFSCSASAVLIKNSIKTCLKTSYSNSMAGFTFSVDT